MSSRRPWWIAVSLFLLSVVVVVVDKIADDLCAPPPGATTFEDVKPRLDNEEPVWLVTVNRESMVVVFGDLNPLNEYRAGYLFEPSGKLRSWSADANQISDEHMFWSVARLGNDACGSVDGQVRKYGKRRKLGTVANITFPIAPDEQ